MSDAPRPKLWIIDTQGIIFQMFHGIGPMNAPDGRPTNAVFGVVRDLLHLYENIRPDYLLCAFDLPEPLKRETLYPAYKKNRSAPPEDLIAQIPVIRQVLEAMNIPGLGVGGYEADDVMATVATAAEAEGMEVAICSADKDCRQLISDNIRMYNLRKRSWLDRAALLEDWSITPEQVVDYQTLVGDSTDNIPGVPGIGPKTAATLLKEHGSLDQLVAKLDAIKAKKTREALKTAKESGTLEISRQLVRLDRSVPLALDWAGWLRREWDSPKLLQLFQELNFNRFANTVRSTMKVSGAKKNEALLEELGFAPKIKSDPTIADGSLFTAALEDLPDLPFPVKKTDAWRTNYHLVDTPEKFADFLTLLSKEKRFAFDLETTSLEPILAEIVGWAISWKAEEGWYIPVRGPEGEAKLAPEDVLAKLGPILADPLVKKVNQNIKYDLLVLRSKGVIVEGVDGDPMLAHYLLHAGERSHGLDEMTRLYFGHENISITALIGKGKKQKRMDEVPIQQVSDYACEDADAAWRLCAKLEAELPPKTLRKLYDEVEIPLIDVLAELELNGIRIDVQLLKKLSDEMAGQLEVIEKQIHQAAGRSFNIASPKQMREVLFDELKLPIQRRTETTNEPSTDQETLEKLARLVQEYPSAAVAARIVEHRQISKLKGTYVDALPELVNAKTGRVHTSFNQTVTATGRLSSSSPNLQNIPTRTDQGRQIRQAFLPREGWKLLCADYSQIELRLLAHFSGDAAMRKSFEEDRDIHTSVAAGIYSVPESEVTSAMRRVAKTVNFGVIYGMSAHGLGERLEIARPEAEKFIRDYFARFPRVEEYQNNLLKQCKKTGIVETILGRKRQFDTNAIPRSSWSWQSRNPTEREAINMEIQGSAADLMKLAMLAVYRQLREKKLQAKLLLTVHDELILEAPPEELATVARLVREEMVGAMKLSVPLKVDVAVGANWLDVEDF